MKREVELTPEQTDAYVQMKNLALARLDSGDLSTTQNVLTQIVETFQDRQSELRFIVGHPKTGGYGLTLTAANTVIYYSNSYDLELRLQSEDRAHRIGQENKVTYIDLISPKTIDEKIVTALRNKIKIADLVLGEDAREWLS